MATVPSTGGGGVGDGRSSPLPLVPAGGKAVVAAAADASPSSSVLQLRDRREARKALAALSSGNAQQRRREGLGSTLDASDANCDAAAAEAMGQKGGGGGAVATSESGLVGAAKEKDVGALEICRCFAHVVEAPARKPATPASLFVARADTIEAYLETNRRVVTWSSGHGSVREIPGALAIEAEGGSGSGSQRRVGLLNGGAEQGIQGILDSKSIVQDPTVVAEGKPQMRQAVLGEGVVVGAKAKVNDCVVMSGAKIGAGAIVQNCVVCAGATVGDGCVLKNCQVAEGFSVAAGTKGDDESFNGGGGAGGGDDDGW